MRSVPQALIWELLSRGRWCLPAAACGANLMPLLIFGALRYHGALDPAEPAFLVMQIVLVQINMFAFGSGVMTAQGPLSRLYAYPVTTATIVTWHLVPAMTLMGLETLASTALMNALFDLGWSLWGPALFAAVALAAVMSAAWLTEKSGWIVWALGLVGGGLGLWFSSRFGPLFSQPTHQWEAVTPIEVATLLLILAASFAVAVWGVSRNRRGEPLPSLGFLAWLERVFDPAPRLGGRFPSPEAGQLWFEWRKKGWAMPAVVAFCVVTCCSGWLIFSREWIDLFEGFVTAGGLLSVLGMLGGVILGNMGPNDSSYEMGHFLGTRPLTNAQWSRIHLLTTAKSVWWAWVLWATPLALLFLGFVVPGFAFLPPVNWPAAWWYVPATLIGPWTVATCCAAVALTGRAHPFAEIFFGGFTLFIGLNVFSSNVLTFEQQRLLGQSLVVLLGLAAVLGTAWLFALARRRGLVAATTAWSALAVWGVLTAVVLVVRHFHPELPWPACAFISGVLALMVAPPAAAPLAIAWNRTR
jgi:hypothetical protein